MTKVENHSRIPNWAMAIFLGTLISAFTGGWIKVDNLEKEVVRMKEAEKFRSAQMVKIDNKLDEILFRLRKLETNN